MEYWRAKARLGAFLVATMIFVSCTDNRATGPEMRRDAAIQFQTGRDSAASQQIASFAPPSNVNSIPLAVGDSIQVTVLSSECSGDPETVVASGVISGLVASGTCNAGGSINGQSMEMGPASSAGSVAFYATHQVFGAGAPGPISGPDASGTYTAFLDDGAGSPDYMTLSYPSKSSTRSPVSRVPRQSSGVRCYPVKFEVAASRLPAGGLTAQTGTELRN